MDATPFKELKITYYYGGRLKLNESLRADKTVCPNGKLYYVTDGSVEIRAGGKSYSVEKNEMTLIPPGAEHSYRLGKAGYAEKYWFHFDLICGGAFANSLFLPEKITVSEPEYVCSLFDGLLLHAGRTAPADAALTAGAAAMIVGYYYEKSGARFKNNPDDEIEAAVKAAEKMPGDKLTVAAMAGAASLSPNYFIRKFKERTGVSPMKYMNMLKLEKAKSMLENTDAPINEVMTGAGYYDAAYFSKLFKSATGCSPKKFREIYGNKLQSGHSDRQD